MKDEKSNSLSAYYKINYECKKRQIPLFIANNVNLLFKLKIKNFYISAFNKKKYCNLSHKINIIGSAHNLIEILEKRSQGCKKIILSRLFQTYKKGHLNIIKFNLLALNYKNIVALGGINERNYKKLKMVNCEGFAMQSELNRKPQYLAG